MLLRLYANSPSKPSLLIVDDFNLTGYSLQMSGLDLGNAAWDHAFSGPVGTQGARPSNGTPQNRPASFPIGIKYAASMDQMLQRISAVEEIVDDMRRFGGRILWQATAQTARQFFEVRVAGMGNAEWTQRSETNFYFVNTLNAVCAPYLSGDPMDTLDTFSIDSIADYTADDGAGTLSVANGVLDPSSTALKRYRHTAKGYEYGDVQVTLKINATSNVALGIWAVMARAATDGTDSSIVAVLDNTATLLRVGKWVGGVFTSLATVSCGISNNSSAWLRLRIEGNVVTAEVFSVTTAVVPPTPVSTPSATVTYALTAAEAGRFASGHVGIRVTPAVATESYDDFAVEPYTYRLISMPEQLRLGGQIPGDVPAIADISATPLGGSATPIWGTVGWLERPAVPNLCWNGDLESSVIGTGGWFATTGGAVIGAGTSVTRDTTATLTKYGVGNLQIVCPATNDTGAHFTLTYRFKKGRQYAAFCWAASAAGTTSAGIKLGAQADFATGTAAALSATEKLYAVTWTPTADVGTALVAFGVRAATATTLNIDGVCVVEVPSCTLSAAINSSVTALTPYSTPTEIPGMQPDGTISGPFRFLIGTELLRCTAIDPTTGIWTVSRGDEGSTAASHSQDDLIILVPHARPQFEGKGASPAFGVIECEAYVAALSSVSAGTLTPTSDANARGALTQTWTPATSGQQSGELVWFIDPNGLYPDDYTLGEVDVEVWVREAWAATLTGLLVTLSAQPEGGLTAGPERFSREYGNVGKLIQPASAKVSRTHKLGTLPLVVDPANPQRWRLKLGLQCTGGATPTWDFDYLLLLPTRSRTPWVTGKPNDTASAAAGVPSFIPYDASWTTTSAMTKRLRSDGSSVISIPGGYGYPDQGPGKPIEIPDTDCDLVVKLSTLVPDDTTLDSTDEPVASITTSVHVAATPRYAIGRGS